MTMQLDCAVLARLGQSAGLKMDLTAVRPDQTFQEIGLDSMSLINLMYALEDEFGLTLTTDEMMEINTLGDMQQLIGRKQAG
ncbi:MAG: acyl carrier protein [Sterolibacterium sp.]|jgi:acyl carrier protein|nr:acyl carrier protein [Sterolibacterium sp.]